jgi:hypothetical protein
VSVWFGNLKVAEGAGCAKKIATEQEKIKASLFMGLFQFAFNRKGIVDCSGFFQLLPIQAMTARLGDRNPDLTKSVFPGKNTRTSNSLFLALAFALALALS